MYFLPFAVYPNGRNPPLERGPEPKRRFRDLIKAEHHTVILNRVGGCEGQSDDDVMWHVCVRTDSGGHLTTCFAHSTNSLGLNIPSTHIVRIQHHVYCTTERCGEGQSVVLEGLRLCWSSAVLINSRPKYQRRCLFLYFQFLYVNVIFFF